MPICPFCLGEDIIENPNAKARQIGQNYICQSSGEHVSAIYVNNYTNKPPRILGVMGNRGHGKSLYLDTLIHTLYQLNNLYPQFHILAVTQNCLTTVMRNIRLLEQGLLPPPTHQTFQNPVQIHINSLPLIGGQSRTLLMYDTAGEIWEATNTPLAAAPFIRRAKTLLFIQSMEGFFDANGQPTNKLSKDIGFDLLMQINSYINSRMEIATEPQQLVVVLTKSDEWMPYLNSENLIPNKNPSRIVTQNDITTLQNYLAADTFSGLNNAGTYMKSLRAISITLRQLLESYYGAAQFVAAATAHFPLGVRFTIVSSLGSRPNTQNRLDMEISPRRVLDPMIWALAQEDDLTTPMVYINDLTPPTKPPRSVLARLFGWNK